MNMTNATNKKARALRKAFAALAASVAAAVLLSGSVFAANLAGTVRVSNYLNVRSAGNTGAPVVGRLYNGAAVTILSSSNGWYKISFGSGSGWVSGVYVTVTSNGASTVVTAAKSALGVRYVYGGASLSGMDCSGLAVYCYAKAGVTLPHSAARQAALGTAVSRSALKAGDLVFFDTDGGNNAITHVGIYIGGGEFISAQSGAGMVKEASLSNSYWSSAYMTARRFF